MCITSGEDYIVGVLFSYIVVLYLLPFTVIIFTYCLHNFEYRNLHIFLTNNIHIKVFNLFRMRKQAFVTKYRITGTKRKLDVTKCYQSNTSCFWSSTWVQKNDFSHATGRTEATYWKFELFPQTAAISEQTS